MTQFSKRERVDAALKGELVDRVPVSAWRHFIPAELSPETLAQMRTPYVPIDLAGNAVGIGWMLRHVGDTRFVTHNGDVAIAISTSGNSPNVLKGVEAAKACGLTTIAWTGGTGGKLVAMVDFPFVVPSKVTARIQESHITLGHVLCELTEEQLLGKAS